MNRGAFERFFSRLELGGLAAFFAALLAPLHAFGQAVSGEGTMTSSFIKLLTERLFATLGNVPKLGDHLMGLSNVFDWRSVALIVGIVVAGLAAEQIARRLLLPLRTRIFERHGPESPLKAFTHGVLLDVLAFIPLVAAASFVQGRLGTGTIPAQVGALTMQTLLYWRGFNLVFRAWLRPNTPEGRIAPVESDVAARLLVGINAIILLPALARYWVGFLAATQGGSEVRSAGVVLIALPVSVALVYVVWHWHREFATWLLGMVAPNRTFVLLKQSLAQNWWVGGIVFYACAGLAACYGALTDRTATARGLAVVESTLIGLLLVETLLHRLTRHLPTEMPTIGEVVAACARLAVRLTAIVIVVGAIVVDTLNLYSPADWAPHGAALKLAAISAFGFYALWRFLKYRMDAYLLAHPLPTAGVIEVDEEAPAAASRLSTVIPVLRVVIGIAILIVGSLLVLSELGINITPLIAGASVLGLAVSFGSQSLVRDIVSGMFFLAEDSFRVGEYIDSGRVKGTVEGFSVRSIKLRHQNGQLHIVPFGQLGHVTNFSRDWTTVKFNLSFRNDTDVELLRKTVKKMGLDMMTEPQFQKELIAPLKMQGIVDIKDAALVIRFKFTARPKNPTLIQRTAIRRMYEQFPAKNIHFALPPVMFPGFGASAPVQQAAQ